MLTDSLMTPSNDSNYSNFKDIPYRYYPVIFFANHFTLRCVAFDLVSSHGWSRRHVERRRQHSAFRSVGQQWYRFSHGNDDDDDNNHEVSKDDDAGTGRKRNRNRWRTDMLRERDWSVRLGRTCRLDVCRRGAAEEVRMDGGWLSARVPGRHQLV